MNIGIYYGTSTGNSKYVADLLVKELADENVTLHNVETDGIASILSYDLVILGASTMENNDIQENWDKHVEDIALLDMRDTAVALYGLGNQQDYPHNFIDAVGMLHESVKAAGARIIGYWPTDGYEYKESLADRGDGRFAGLALDEDIQPELTVERVSRWVKQLKSEL